MADRRLRYSLLWLVVVYALILSPVSLVAGGPPKKPMLRVETGMHNAIIKRIGIDEEAQFLITGADDKTARVWDLNTGRLLQTLRPPIGDGNEGKLYCAAITPDGRTVAVAGWTGWEWEKKISIYLFDRQTGSLIKRLDKLPNVVMHLAYSKDGRYMAVLLGRNNGLRVFSVPDYKEVAKDTDYATDGYGADFDAQGRLVTASFDGYLRLYNSKFKRIVKKKAPGGGHPYAVAFSPDGGKVAVGYHESNNLDVFSGKDLKKLYSPKTGNFKGGNLMTVCWSSDGEYLYAGGRYDINDRRPIVKFPDQGRGEPIQYPVALSTILNIQPLPGGGVAFGAADPAWGAIDNKGELTVVRKTANADFRDNHDGFLLSWDGDVVHFAYEVWGKSPARFSILDRELDPDNPQRMGLFPARTSGPGINLTDWKNNYSPKLNGQVLTIDNYEEARAVAVMPDGSGFLLGADWSLRFFDPKGKLIWQTAIPSNAWAVNISENGKLCAASLGDGTIRWYRVTDGQELMAFFPHSDRKRWVLWSPAGYYDASAGGEDLIGWHINRDAAHESDFFPASRFRNALYRPDVVAQILQTADEDRAVQLANEGTKRKETTVAVEQILPPVVQIVAPLDGSQFSGQKVTLRYALRVLGDEPITRLRVLIDGRPLKQDQFNADVSLTPGEHDLTVQVPPRDVEIGLIPENQHSAGEPALIRLRWSGAPAEKDDFTIKPKLYVLAIGVSDYENDDLDLTYASKDATDFAEILKKQNDLLYRKVEIRLLTDKNATKDDVLDGLEWIGRQTTSKDVAMIFLAGHGVNDEFGDYYFLPGNTDLDRLRRTGLPFTEIEKTISTLSGKTLFFVDTCHSGNIMGARRGVADINALVNELASAENGAVVFASSTGRQYSLESQSWGNGAFTKALVEGLGGKADYVGRGKVTINMLDLYLSERVKELTGGKQTPTTAKPNTIQDYPIALID